MRAMEDNEMSWEREEIPLENLYLGQWGNARRSFLMSERPNQWQEMLQKGTAKSYLTNYQEEYSQKADRLEKQLMERNGIPEQLPPGMPCLEYAGLLNQVREIVQECLLREICEMD
ncbi:MAG: TnpV protein [Selenomonadaceae bacterium]|nr:TnpV protein [Selenomonadaceae bacterium]